MAEQSMKNGFSKLAKDKNSKKILIGIGAVVVFAGAYAYIGAHHSSNDANIKADNVRSAPTVVGGDIGGNVAPEKYRNLIKDNDQSRIQQAKQDGGSATPTLIMNSSNDKKPLTLDSDNEHGMDDVSPNQNNNPLSNIEDNPLPTAPVVNPTVEQPVQVAQVDPNLVQAMMQKMQEIRRIKNGTASTVYLYKTTVGNGSSNEDISSGPHNASSKNLLGVNGQNPFSATSPNKGSSGVTGNNSYNDGPTFQVPVAGTILASKLLGKVDSNINGPVIGEVEEGSFAGARLLGSFQFTEAGLILHFNSMTVSYTNDDGEKKAEVVKINALAVNSDDLSPGMATSIDRHVIERIAAQFGSAFLQGLGQAAAQSGSTAVVSPYGGTTVSNPSLTLTQQMLMATGTGASQAGSIFQEIYGNQRTTIKVQKDTPFGLLFVNTDSSN